MGLVFQYPEHQLFEVDVLSDVCFGPKNQGLSPEEAKERARGALRMVGISEEYEKQSPFELSGGQKRRVAIAGVLAMEPEVLILDEPTAGLDPKGRDEILDEISSLHKERGITVILVSHSMEDVAKYVERIIVMNQGEVLHDGAPREVFRHYKELESVGLAAPQVTYIVHTLKDKGFDVDEDATTIEGGEGDDPGGLPEEGKEAMIRDITLGQYYPADSILHRLDPRVKLMGTILFLVGLFLIKGWAGYAVATVFLFAMIRISKVPFRFIVRGLKTIFIILLITLVFNLFLTPGGPGAGADLEAPDYR